MMCFPVEKVISIHTFLLTFEGVDLSNIFSRFGFGRYENFNLLSLANTSFTKLWDNPESSNAWNGWSRLWMEVEVRERKNELGDREEVCRATELALQPIQSTGCDGLPICLTGWAPQVLLVLQRLMSPWVFQQVAQPLMPVRAHAMDRLQWIST